VGLGGWVGVWGGVGGGGGLGGVWGLTSNTRIFFNELGMRISTSESLASK